MAEHHLQQRKAQYFKLNSQIAQIDNAQMHAMFDQNGVKFRMGWGRNHTVDIDSAKVFVKRIPLTDVEYEAMFSTKNVYNLPLYYNYALGSAGFGLFRELTTYIKTTNWVLQGMITTFPLMYHYRIIPFSGVCPDVDMARHNNYVAYWNNSANIGRFLLDRANVNYEAVLFLEHIPYTLETWLLDNPHKLPQFFASLCTTLTFLLEQGIIHFDTSLSNILTDGERVYLTDFGLALDKNFALTQEEDAFFQQNTYYPYGAILADLGYPISQRYEALPESDKNKIMKKYGIKAGIHLYELILILIKNIEKIYADGTMKLDEDYVAYLVEYQSILVLMNEFYADMSTNNQKDTKFPQEKLGRLLKETGFLPCTNHAS